MKMICGATGKECPMTPNECGVYPCKECEHGKRWQTEPVLHDEEVK